MSMGSELVWWPPTAIERTSASASASCQALESTGRLKSPATMRGRVPRACSSLRRRGHRTSGRDEGRR
eukprot:8395624-Alexandrium_andersonii.AAC.1